MAVSVNALSSSLSRARVLQVLALFQVSLCSPNMHRQISFFLQALIEDLKGSDPDFIYELADEVRTLAVDHKVASQGQANRTLICMLACKDLALCPISQRASRARSSWDRLTVLEKMALKQAVRMPRRAHRTKALLNLAGVEEEAEPILRTHDVTCLSWTTGIGFDHDVRADADDTMTRSPTRGAGETKRMSL